MPEGQIVPDSLYVYAPNKGAPIFFTVAFGLSAIFHIWQCFYHKTFMLMGLHALVAALFTVGYAMREYGAQGHYLYNGDNSQTLIIYILSQVFIYVGPPLLELSNYHILGRIFSYVPYLAPLPPGQVLAIFGGLMGLVEALNALGVAFSSNPTGTKQGLGKVLILVALALQLCVVTIFVFIASIFHRRYTRSNLHSKPVPTLMIVLYISMFLILVRCVYRIVEHAGNTTVDLDNPESLGTLSPLLRYEWFFYVFDASAMLLNSILWNVWNPGRFLPRDRNAYLAEDDTVQLADRLHVNAECEGEQPIIQGGDERSTTGKVIYAVLFFLTFGLSALFYPRNKRH